MEENIKWEDIQEICEAFPYCKPTINRQNGENVRLEMQITLKSAEIKRMLEVVRLMQS